MKILHTLPPALIPSLQLKTTETSKRYLKLLIILVCVFYIKTKCFDGKLRNQKRHLKNATLRHISMFSHILQFSNGTKYVNRNEYVGCQSID